MSGAIRVCHECCRVREPAFEFPVSLPEAGPEPYMVGTLCAECSAKFPTDAERRAVVTRIVRELHDEERSLPAYYVVRRLPMRRQERPGAPTPATVEYVVEGPFWSEHGSFATEANAEAEAARLNWIPAPADLQRPHSGAALDEVNERVREHFEWFMLEWHRQEGLLQGAQLEAHRAGLAVVEAKKAEWDRAYAAEREAWSRLGCRDRELLPETCRALDEVRAALTPFATR